MGKLKQVICLECNGEGGDYISCCGDDMSNIIPESDNCPSCKEHCGDCWQDCDECLGTGKQL